jgi:hypothetical protein
MSEPTITVKREVMGSVKKSKIDLKGIERKQGALSPAKDAKPKNKFDNAHPETQQEMDLGRVDNDNRGSYNGETIKKQEPTMKNFDFNKAHDDFTLIKDSKKKPGAGQ